MKAKPAVKNELFLEDALTLHNEDTGATLRCALQWGDMLRIQVHEPKDKEYKDVLILITSEQMEQLITLWQEWRDEDGLSQDG
jgi:hypothetical protein